MRRDVLLMAVSLPVMLVLIAAGHFGFDRPIADFCSGLSVPVVAFFEVVTKLGVSTLYLVGGGALFLYFFYMARNRTQAERMFYLFSAIAISGLVTDLIKWLMGRWRPKVFFPDGLYGFEFFGTGYEQTSFPSGHATTICALTFTLSILYPRLRWLWIIIAFLVSLSRVVIGAHYLSDVLMGAYVGIFVAFLLRKWPLFGKRTKERLPT